MLLLANSLAVQLSMFPIWSDTQTSFIEIVRHSLTCLERAVSEFKARIEDLLCFFIKRMCGK